MVIMIGKDFKFTKIDNFLTIEERMLIKDYAMIRHRLNINAPDMDEVSEEPNFTLYGDPLFDSLMLQKQKLVEKESGLTLLPTYSFFRLYTRFSKLKKHKDRPSCEISVTVCIDNDGEQWPIYMNGTPIYLKPGEAALYLGQEVEHWRDELKGDYSSYVFLHYVNKEGNFQDFLKDKRELLGMQK
jgi:hypothetical protein